MKNQALFSSKDKSKKLKCCLLNFLGLRYLCIVSGTDSRSDISNLSLTAIAFTGLLFHHFSKGDNLMLLHVCFPGQ